jgi:hypothetical protein
VREEKVLEEGEEDEKDREEDEAKEEVDEEENKDEEDEELGAAEVSTTGETQDETRKDGGQNRSHASNASAEVSGGKACSLEAPRSGRSTNASASAVVKNK